MERIDMERNSKTIAALTSGAILLSGLFCQSAHASLLNISGTSVLADTRGATSGPEAITVSWSVVENVSDVYTYSFSVNNPLGDVVLSPSADAGASEIVDTFVLNFDASAITGLSFPANTTAYALGPYGIYWAIYPDVVVAGTNSGALSFQSLLPPSPGIASASDDSPPSPWSSSPSGQYVPVPGIGNFSVPDSTNTIAMLAGMLLLLPFQSALKMKRKVALARSR